VDNGVCNDIALQENKVLFIGETLMKEVMNGSSDQQKKALKKLKRLQKQFVLILGASAASIMTLPLTGFAQSNQGVPGTLTTENTVDITPGVVMEWGLTIALITVAIGVAISGSLLAIAGIYRMFRKREESQIWTTDIIKGLVQVLIALPVVYSLFYLAQLVFGNLPVLEGLL
jgi:hypothetical protein